MDGDGVTPARALQPLTHGNVLIVGTKASNLDEELRSNPRVILWSSEAEHWTDKELPVNVRAVFIGRWIGHTLFGRIQREAKKRHITIFNQYGTGAMTKQVRELLAIDKPQEPEPQQPEPKQEEPMVQKPALAPKPSHKGKLIPLEQYIDWDKSNIDNARIMLAKAKELGIETTEGSLCQYVRVLAQKQGKKFKIVRPTRPVKLKVQDSKLDVSVALLDDTIKQLTDVRDYLIAVVKENMELKGRIERFKKALEG